ncbi:MAG: hypothetical protein FWE09_08455 [Treponema sp.]|nr:hypothetical protein [Treponema sp.]
MKKFFVVLFILVLLAGAGLFFGWAQRGVPPGAEGVLISRSHGVDGRLVTAGEFRWIWQRLIPTNSRMLSFRRTVAHRQFSDSGALPSGRIYAAFLGIQEDFSWEISGSLSFRLRSSALIPLVESGLAQDQAELDAYMGALADEMRAVVIGWFDRDAARGTQALLTLGEIPALSAEIERRFPSVEGFSLRIVSARLPDFELYEQARAQHREFIAMQREHVESGMAAMAADRLWAFSRIAELELYGDLLSRFPVLLDLLSIEGALSRGE